MCPSTIVMYGEMIASPLACVLLHSGQLILFAYTFYLYLVFTLGHFLSGAETELSILFLCNTQHRHICCLLLLVMLYVMPVTNRSDTSLGDLWLAVHTMEM